MTYDEQVAHHESAHVVMSFLFGGGPTLHGIDIKAPSSATGASGNAGVAKMVHDPSLSPVEQRKDLVCNVAIICAGAACDAKTTGRSIDVALDMQPGDRDQAKAEIAQSPLLASSDEAERKLVLKMGLETAEGNLAQPNVWALVERVARACLGNGGKLSCAEITSLLTS